MRLRKFEIKNYKAIQTLSFEWDDLITLIGEHNCGKSSVLSALSCFLGGGSIKDASVFRRNQTGHQDAIELIGHFDQLTETELQQTAIRGRVLDGEWILKKRFWLEGGENVEPERAGWKEQLYTFSQTEAFREWPEQDTTWAAFPAAYQPLIEQIPNRGPRPNVVTRDVLRQLVKAQRADLVTQTAAAWVPNPGGGGNWKSNANSILPRVVFIRAVHEASDETVAKDASTYGRLINLIVERQIAQRPEMIALREALDAVLRLFRPDQEHPEFQAEEIRNIQGRINRRLEEIIGGHAFIHTEPPQLRSLVMPNTSLVIRDPLVGIDTQVGHQGHGLQRTLVMTLLQLLSEVQGEASPDQGLPNRATVLIVEEPELYLHPQMARLMRDVLYRLATSPNMQVACCTHSPVFLDIANRYRSIVRVIKGADGNSTGIQVTQDIFPGPADRSQKEQLQTVARFHPTINELFFARSVVLFEEFSTIVTLERAAELSGLFDRHPRIRREVSLVDCGGKQNIPAFQRVLNAFGVPYRVVHDLDQGNPTAFAENARIEAAFPQGAINRSHAIGPEDLESLLGHEVPKNQSKPFANVRRVEELQRHNNIPPALTQAVNMAYFGQLAEPL